MQIYASEYLKSSSMLVRY